MQASPIIGFARNGSKAKTMCRAAVCAGDRTEAHQDGPVSKAYAQYPAPSVVFMRRQALTIDATALVMWAAAPNSVLSARARFT